MLSFGIYWLIIPVGQMIVDDIFVDDSYRTYHHFLNFLQDNSSEVMGIRHDRRQSFSFGPEYKWLLRHLFVRFVQDLQRISNFSLAYHGRCPTGNTIAPKWEHEKILCFLRSLIQTCFPDFCYIFFPALNIHFVNLSAVNG